MRLRVVCGLRVTMASFSPTSAFNKVDLPALGRPMMDANPERKGIDSHAPGRRLRLQPAEAAGSHGRGQLVFQWTQGPRSVDRSPRKLRPPWECGRPAR